MAASARWAAISLILVAVAGDGPAPALDPGPPPPPADLQRICRTAIESNDPPCANQGVIFGRNNSQYDNCGHCTCPEGWAGIDCSVCQSVDVCPEDQHQAATSCSSGSIAPLDAEVVTGKTLSCTCGGLTDDARDTYACQAQPGTSWTFQLPADPDADPATATWAERLPLELSVYERAGTPSQDLNPDPGCRRCKGKGADCVCPTSERYDFAFPAVWNGTIHGCSWEVAPCSDADRRTPLDPDSSCLVYSCHHIDLDCPPPTVDKCPGWTPLGCGYPPGQPLVYWSHHCSPVALPKADKITSLTCQQTPAADGKFQCYFVQVDSFVPYVGMQCHTGSCLHSRVAPPPPPPAPPHRRLGRLNWEIITVVGLVALAAGLVGASALFVVRDRAAEACTHPDAASGSDDLTQPLLGAADTAPDDPPPPRVLLTWCNIRHSVVSAQGKRRTILQDVFGSTGDPDGGGGGGLTAILGPSGAGKTTLLDCLAGRLPGVAHTCDIRADGRPVDAPGVRAMSGYVLQDDVLPGTSTVWEHVLFHAQLRLRDPADAPRRAAEVLQQLGLTRVTHSFIGDQYTRGLSGGEQRRVSLAVELLARPALLFLDEPTTGLDSTNAAAVVDLLSGLAAAGVTVVLSIHQPRPDIFRLMSSVLLLSATGAVAYSGPLSAAAPHFAALGHPLEDDGINPADHMLDLVIRSDVETVDVLVSAAVGGPLLSRLVALTPLHDAPAPAVKFGAPCRRQLAVLSHRHLRNIYRHPLLMVVNFVATAAMAAALGAVFRDTGTDTPGIQNRLGCLFFMLLYLSCMSLSSLPIWQQERLLFVRERDAGVYSTPAYFASQLLFDVLPLRILPPVFFLGSYVAIGLHPGSGFAVAWFLLLLVLANAAATCVSMMIGVAAPSAAVANSLGAMAILGSMLFGGFMINKDAVNGKPLLAGFQSFSYFNYAFEALAVNEFHHSPLDFTLTTPVSIPHLPPVLPLLGDKVLENFGFNYHGRFVLRDAAMLGVIGGAAAAATLLLLHATGPTARAARQRILQAAWGCLSTPPPEVSRVAAVRQHNGTSVDPRSFGLNGGAAPAEALAALSPGSTTDGSAAAASSSGPGSARGRATVSLSWEGVSAWVTLSTGVRRQILHDVQGVAGPPPDASGGSPSLTPPGSCVFAILGPSGAGKTTLLDTLAGFPRQREVTGTVRVAGLAVSPPALRRLSGYVPQTDVLPGSSTVLEYLMFHARLRLPPATSPAAARDAVDALLGDLSLRKVAHSAIGDAFVRGLSGGERRRVSIACELLTDPGVLFLDEPTTGLDSTSAKRVVDIMAAKAAAGVTVVLSIHQPRPDIFRLLDRVLILSARGRVVYTGPTSQAADFFSGQGLTPPPPPTNVSDWMLDVVIRSPDSGVDRLVAAYAGSAAKEADGAAISQLTMWDAMHGAEQAAALECSTKYAASFTSQLTALSGRLLRNTVRHPVLVCLNYVAAVLMAAGMGWVYRDIGTDTPGIQDRLGSLFVLMVFFSLISLSSIPIWQQDRLLFLRERAGGAYGTSSYFTAVVLFDLLPLRVLPPLAFGCITYAMAGYNAGAGAADWGVHCARYCLVLVLVNLNTASINMAVGAAVRDGAVANVVGSLAALLSLLFGGFLLARTVIPAPSGGGWAAAVVRGVRCAWDVGRAAAGLLYVRLGYEALVVNEFGGATGFRFTVPHAEIAPGTAPEDIPHVDVTGDEILAMFNFDRGAYWRNVGMLVASCATYLTYTYLFLKYKGRV